MSEHQEQARLVSWAVENERWLPELKMLFAIPNGGKRKNGWWEVAEGLKRGVPDLFLAAQKHHRGVSWGGMFIEMKFGKNKPTKDQKEWLSELEEANYYCVVCHSWEEAKKAILFYLGQPG